jgi:hypothetical protein
MVKNRQKGITKAYRNDKKDVDTRTNTDVHVDQEKVLSWLKWIWREASPA